MEAIVTASTYKNGNQNEGCISGDIVKISATVKGSKDPGIVTPTQLAYLACAENRWIWEPDSRLL